MQVQPYLNFDGRAEEAIEFYRKALGAEVLMLMRFKDGPEGCVTQPGSEEKILHSCLRIGDTTIMAADCHNAGQAAFQGFSLSLSAASDAEAERLFAAISQGGQVQMPLTKTFFSSSFGVAADPFGVSWMIVVAPAVADTRAA
jgi:PhnB protein